MDTARRVETLTVVGKGLETAVGVKNGLLGGIAELWMDECAFPRR